MPPTRPVPQSSIRQIFSRPLQSFSPSRAPFTLSRPARVSFNSSRNFSISRVTNLLPQQTRNASPTLFRSFRGRPHISRRMNSTNPGPKPSESLSFSQRFKQLSREYGRVALVVYLGLSALDFPFCFLAVRLLGADRIAHYESVAREAIKSAFSRLWPFGKTRETESGDNGELATVAPSEAEAYDYGVAEAEKRNAGPEASLWTQLLLAYAVHKSFIFIRVPLTAAVLPKVVRVLRRWGWDIGKRKPKAK